MYALAILLGSLALAGWGPAGCGPVGPTYEWRTLPGDPERSYLYRDGVQVAGYDHQHHVYRTYDAATDTWGPPAAPPWKTRAPACRCSPDCPCGSDCRCPGGEPCCSTCSCRKPAKKSSPAESVVNFGVDTEKLTGTRAEQYRLNGRPVSREQAFTALEGKQLPDDAARLRLTILGTDDQRRQIRQDLAAAPELAEFKDRLVVQDYPPDHWAVAHAGFDTTGHPTLYLQQPSGKVLHRQNDYSGPTDLARALRKADPNYDPHKDPDLRRLSGWPRWNGLSIPAAAWLLAAGVLFLLLRKGRS